MESAARFMCILASSNLWLTGSGLVLWNCLRSRLRLSPGTRAAASILVVLQGWIWIGIPVELDLTWILQPAPIQSPQTSPIDTAQALAPLPSDSQPSSGSESLSGSGPLSGLGPLSAARSVPDVWPLAGAAACAIWLAGIAILLGRSTGGLIALSRMVQMLPSAPVEWQNELTALCRHQTIARPPVLKISRVAAPMLVQTLGGICIVVPAWLWQSCSAEQRRSMLLHELAHYKRGDLWRQLAMRLLVLPHWFNPVAWWAARQFEAASEAACDDAACGGNPLVAVSYSKALLVLNERLSGQYAQALAISGGSLTERIRRVLNPESQKESRMSRFLVLSALIVLTSLATIRIQAADPSPATKNESAENGEAKNEPAKTPAGSLLANGGFEEVQDNSNDPQAWFGTRIPQTAGHFLLASSSVAHSGERSVVVEIGDNHPDRRVDYNWTALAEGWKAGETYELSGWIKTEGAKYPAVIMVQCWNEETKRGKMIGAASTEQASPVKGTTDWTKVSTRFVVPEGTGVVRIRAGLSSQDNRGAKAWLDDISLVKVASN